MKIFRKALSFSNGVFTAAAVDFATVAGVATSTENNARATQYTYSYIAATNTVPAEASLDGGQASGRSHKQYS